MPQENKTDEVVLSAEALEAIGKTVAEKSKSLIAEEIKSALDARDAEKEAIINKQIDAAKSAELKDEYENLSKEVRFMRTVKALTRGDSDSLIKFNTKALELRTKAGYANEGVLAEGGYIVMDPEFEAEVEKLMPNYGVALRESTVRFINGNSVKTNKRGSNVSLTEINTEGGAKPGTKMTINQITVTLREFAAIAIATNRLIEDEAIDFWQEVTEGFAEAWAQKIDEMAYTESGTVYKGLLHIAGTNVFSVGANITSLTWDNLLDAEASIPSAARSNMKHLMHRTVWNILNKTKDSQGRYQWLPTMGLQTPWGTPVILSDAMPTASSKPDNNEGYIITGDLKRVTIYTKRGLVLDRSDEATVQDSDGNTVNLWQRNMQAMKAEVRAATLVKFPEAFAIIGIGTVS